MALVMKTTIRPGIIRQLKNPALLGQHCDLWNIRVATLTGKALRVDNPEKVKPWNYKRWGYRNPMAFFDGTTKRFDMNTRVIFVEGLPAIGKSKVAAALADDFGMKYFPMPTMDYLYINSYGYDMRVIDDQLPKEAQSYDEKKFLKEPHHPSTPVLPFGLYEVKLSQYIDALVHLFNTGQGVVLERSLYTDFIFAEAMFKFGYLTKYEVDGYHIMRKKTITEVMRPHLVVYLDASIDTVLENFKKRGHGEEKVYNRQFLEHVDELYKKRALVDMDRHAHVLVYDWNKPGDVETMVEDIEKMDFEGADIHSEKMKDWRLMYDFDYCMYRHKYSYWKSVIMNRLQVPLLDCPRLYLDTAGNNALDALLERPGTGWQYAKGHNADMGDTGFWHKLSWTPTTVSECLPEYVTEMLIKKSLAADP